MAWFVVLLVCWLVGWILVCFDTVWLLLYVGDLLGSMLVCGVVYWFGCVVAYCFAADVGV